MDEHDLPSFGYDHSKSSGEFVKFVSDAEKRLGRQGNQTPIVKAEALQRALKLVARREDENEAFQYNNHIPPPNRVAGYPQRRDIPPAPAPIKEDTEMSSSYDSYESSADSSSRSRSRSMRSASRKRNWYDGMDMTEFLFYSIRPPGVAPEQPELEPPPGKLITFDPLPEESTTSKNSEHGRVHYEGQPPLAPGERPDRFDAPATPEPASSTDPHFEDNMSLGEIRFYTRQDMLGELELPNQVSMDDELQFVYELYQQRLYGEPRHCDLLCDPRKDPITCCWYRKWAKLEEMLMASAEQDSKVKRELILDQYTRDVRHTIFKHMRRNQIWPEQYPEELESELEKFYHKTPQPTSEDYRRFGKECGLGSEGVIHFYEEKRKQKKKQQSEKN